MATQRSVPDLSDEAQKHLEQAYSSYERNDLEDALRECEVVIRLESNCAEAHNLRGLVLEGLGRKGEAIVAYREASRLDSTFRDAQDNLLELERELGETRADSGTHSQEVIIRRPILDGYETSKMVCPKCRGLYNKDAYTTSCYTCHEPLSEHKVFVRWHKERILYLILLGCIPLLAMSLVPQTILFNSAWGLLCAGPPGIIAAYVLAAQLFEMGRLWQFFDLDRYVPKDEDLRFSWGRFLIEPFFMLVIVAIVILLWLGVEVVKWLTSGGGKFPS